MQVALDEWGSPRGGAACKGGRLDGEGMRDSPAFLSVVQIRRVGSAAAPGQEAGGQVGGQVDMGRGPSAAQRRACAAQRMLACIIPQDTPQPAHLPTTRRGPLRS